ncbi:MAG TPA: twin-arginine translocase TatA/TatE family subunit [Actinomycetota bacterium]|nr:twin-arginine translocase TatA/TatE family subunit [Actinomycetota bacterium]
MRFLGGPEVLLVVLLIVLLFGASRLPRLARSMREARDEFEKGRTDSRDESEKGGTGSRDLSRESRTVPQPPAAADESA